MDNREVMERFGFRLCAHCNADMPADGFVGDRCRYCAETPDEAWARNVLENGDWDEPESSYDRVRRGIDEHDAWKKERARTVSTSQLGIAMVRATKNAREGWDR